MRTRITLIAAAFAVVTSWAARADGTATALSAGWENYRLSEFERAIRFFEDALHQAPAGSEARLQALYGLGTTWNLRRPNEDRAKAEAYFQQIMAAAPAGEVGAWTALALARMKHLVPVGQEPDIAAVRQAYTDIMRRYPGHLAAKEAFIYDMSTFIATLEEAQTRYAIANLQRFVQKPGAREFLQPAWSLMTVGYTTLQQPDQRLYAELMALKTVEVDPSNPFTEFAWAYWNIATIAEFEVGNFPLARQYYRRLIQEYPRDVRVFGSRQALERMDKVEATVKKGDRRLEIRDLKSERPSHLSNLPSQISHLKSPISSPP